MGTVGHSSLSMAVKSIQKVYFVEFYVFLNHIDIAKYTARESSRKARANDRPKF